MNPCHLLRLAATVTDRVPSATERDEFGDPVLVESAPVTYLGWYEQAQRSEDTAGTNQQSERWRLFLESAAAGVTGHAKVSIGGLEFEFDGPPWPATNPRTASVSHVEAWAKRVV